MNIEELTLKQIRELQSVVSSGSTRQDDSHWVVGKNYFIRTVTHYFTGQLVKATSNELVLRDATWIADTGRYHEMLNTGVFDETEPYPDGAEVIVGRGALIDATEWKHALPREAK